MSTRPPADAVVALRSLSRRSRGLFAGLQEDEAPEDLAHRNGAGGASALDEVVAATRTITFLDRALEQVLVSDDPVLHPGVSDPAERDWPPADGSVEARLDELAAAAERMADRAAHVHAEGWSRTGRVAGRDAAVSALSIIWDAVDSSLEHLRTAQRTLAEVRGRA